MESRKINGKGFNMNTFYVDFSVGQLVFDGSPFKNKNGSLKNDASVAIASNSCPSSFVATMAGDKITFKQSVSGMGFVKYLAKWNGYEIKIDLDTSAMLSYGDATLKMLKGGKSANTENMSPVMYIFHMIYAIIFYAVFGVFWLIAWPIKTIIKKKRMKKEALSSDQHIDEINQTDDQQQSEE